MKIKVVFFGKNVVVPIVVWDKHEGSPTDGQIIHESPAAQSEATLLLTIESHYDGGPEEIATSLTSYIEALIQQSFALGRRHERGEFKRS
ncbi:MAG: hypothetical protein HYV68_03580 [Candidatus Taylorbacteria bacterium]|nr:hypothetical protein [Candidatus Taylorbacteria bacterium]